MGVQTKGEKGERGERGQDGISPTVTITPITGGHRITITDADGEHSADVMDGTMLGIADLIGNSEGATASKAYSVGDVLLHDGKLYKVTASIAQGSAIVPNTNCTQTTIIDLLR